jgi:hypothetical protein
MALTWPIYGTQASVYIHTATITLATNAAMLTTTNGVPASGTAYTAEIKDWKITGGERDLEVIKMLGYTEQANYKRATPFEMSGTLLFRDVDVWQFACGTGSTGNVGGATETYTPIANAKRVHFGEKQTNDRVPQAVYLIGFTASGNYIAFLMNGAVITTVGDVTVNADDAIEQSITFKCLATNCWLETYES